MIIDNFENTMPYPSFPGMPPGKSITGTVDYDIKKLEWNKYEFGDGVTLCVVSIPQVVFSTNAVDQKGVPVFVVTWNTITRSIVPENSMGEPSTIVMTPEQMSKATSKEVRPLISQEPWNEFVLKDGHTLRGKIVVTEIRRMTTGFDQMGMPMFSISAQNVLGVSLTEMENDSR